MAWSGARPLLGLCAVVATAAPPRCGRRGRAGLVLTSLSLNVSLWCISAVAPSQGVGGQVTGSGSHTPVGLSPGALDHPGLHRLQWGGEWWGDMTEGRGEQELTLMGSRPPGAWSPGPGRPAEDDGGGGSGGTHGAGRHGDGAGEVPPTAGAQPLQPLLSDPP